MKNEITAEIIVEAAQSCLSPQQYEHFESLLENDEQAHERLAKSIQKALESKSV